MEKYIVTDEETDYMEIAVKLTTQQLEMLQRLLIDEIMEVLYNLAADQDKALALSSILSQFIPKRTPNIKIDTDEK